MPVRSKKKVAYTPYIGDSSASEITVEQNQMVCSVVFGKKNKSLDVLYIGRPENTNEHPN